MKSQTWLNVQTLPFTVYEKFYDFISFFNLVKADETLSLRTSFLGQNIFDSFHNVFTENEGNVLKKKSAHIEIVCIRERMTIKIWSVIVTLIYSNVSQKKYINFLVTCLVKKSCELKVYYTIKITMVTMHVDLCFCGKST